MGGGQGFGPGIGALPSPCLYRFVTSSHRARCDDFGSFEEGISEMSEPQATSSLVPQRTSPFESHTYLLGSRSRWNQYHVGAGFFKESGNEINNHGLSLGSQPVRGATACRRVGKWEGRRSVVMGLSGRILLAVAAVVFGLAVFWVHGSIGSITGSSLQTASERNVPIFEPGDEEPTANRPEDDVPEPILVPALTQTPSLEPTEIAANPQVSEAGEIAGREPFAEGAKKSGEATDKDGLFRGTFGSPASLPAEYILPQAKSPLSDSTSFGSPPSENTPALSQEGPAPPTADPYTDETLLPASTTTAPYDTPMSTEETTPPPEPVMDMGTSTLPPEPPGETTTSFSDLPADSPPFAEDAANVE
jgi:hypothetical protein